MPEQTSKVAITVLAQSGADASEIAFLETRFTVQTVDEIPDIKKIDLALWLDNDGLSLVGGGQMLRGDFSRMLARIVPNNLNRELLVKAAKIKDAEGVPTAIDATAGMGEDALLLAAAGFHVKLYERDCVIAALLHDTLRRAANVPELAPIVARMELFLEDSVAAMPNLEEKPDVVLLDPMFPTRQKSALIKKKFQLLQKLERPCSDEDELLKAALACHPHKVVIKRPMNAESLAGCKPAYAIKGKTIRYDCLVLPRE